MRPGVGPCLRDDAFDSRANATTERLDATPHLEDVQRSSMEDALDERIALLDATRNSPPSHSPRWTSTNSGTIGGLEPGRLRERSAV